MARVWIQLGMGVWVALSPWILGGSDEVFLMWSSLLVGVALVVVNLWAIFGREPGVAPDAPSKSEERRGNGKK